MFIPYHLISYTYVKATIGESIMKPMLVNINKKIIIVEEKKVKVWIIVSISVEDSFSEWHFENLGLNTKYKTYIY